MLKQVGHFARLAVLLRLTGASPAICEELYFGEDVNATATGQNEDAVRIAHPNADEARNAFLARLSGIGTETFESFEPDSSASTLSFGPDTATLSPPLTVLNVSSGTFFGVYPISGDQTLLQSVEASNTFRIDFSSPQSAFGFYVTDLELVGNLTLRFHLAGGDSTVERPVPTEAGTNGANNTGSVAFFGVIDTENPFVAVTFVRTLSSSDGFGFDDLTIGRSENVIQVPASAVLAVVEVITMSIAALLMWGRR